MSNIDIKTLEIKKEAEQWKKGGRTLYNKAEAIEPISNELTLSPELNKTLIKTKDNIELYARQSEDMHRAMLEIARLYETSEQNITKSKIKSKGGHTPISNGHDNGLNSNDKTDSDKENFNSIKYKGEEYPIYIPEDKGPTLQSAEKWENVYEDSIMDLDFDFEKAIMGFSLEEPNRNVFPGTRSNANTLVATHILLGIFGGVVAGASTTSIDVYLQERPIAGSKRAVIGVRNSQAAEKLQNFDYSKPFSSYEYMKQNGDGAAQNKMDRAVAGLYENVTGKKSNPIKYRYDVQVTLDERHKNDRYQSYISIDEDGNYVKTNVSYSKDEVRIVVRDVFGRETGESYVVDSNDSATEVFDPEISDMLREVLGIE